MAGKQREETFVFFFFFLGEFMPGTLKVYAERAGTIGETTALLSDLETAYVSLFQLEAALRLRQKGTVAEFVETGTPHPASLLPEYRLVISRVRIESPGFWEFIGSLNPLQQIREYLNDRHRRRQDREYREPAEAVRLRLENELVQHTIWEKENAVLKGRIEILRGAGYTDREIRQLIWAHCGVHFARLGLHQDSGIIVFAE